MNIDAITAENRAMRIRALNDRLRTTGLGGRILITRSVIDLGSTFVQAAVNQMRTFFQFDSGDDPYREHDFGSFENQGEMLFFKIDYYDASMTAGCEDPADPAKCTCVLTLMLAADY